MLHLQAQEKLAELFYGGVGLEYQY